jgi:hypothetical protein
MTVGEEYILWSLKSMPFALKVVGRPAGHQIQMLEQSPSLRKNRYFF